MLKFLKIQPVCLLAALALGGTSPSAWAAPNLWWDHFEASTASQSDCVKQAESILVAEKAGQLSSDADSVRAWSENTISVAECIKFGDKLIVALMVSSEDSLGGSKFFNALRTGMLKK